MAASPREIVIYIWARALFGVDKALRDVAGRAIIRARINRVRLGNFGDCKSVGGGVLELRIDSGPGYRVYLAKDGAALVVLLNGGDKRTQKCDIAQAQRYWKDYRSRDNG